MTDGIEVVKITVKKTKAVTKRKGIVTHRAYSIALPKTLLREIGVLKGEGESEELAFDRLILKVIDYQGKKAIVLMPP